MASHFKADYPGYYNFASSIEINHESFSILGLFRCTKSLYPLNLEHR